MSEKKKQGRPIKYKNGGKIKPYYLPIDEQRAEADRQIKEVLKKFN